MHDAPPMNEDDRLCMDNEFSMEGHNPYAPTVAMARQFHICMVSICHF